VGGAPDNGITSRDAENAKTSRKRHWAFMAELQNLRMTGKLLDDYERILT
jgi:hypothetical protein